MAEPPAIASEKYVRLTTYTKDGRPKYAPVWIVDVGEGKVGFNTEAASWKVKRLRNDPRVAIQPSNSRGAVKEGSEELLGTAAIVTGDDREAVAAKVKSKYGWQWGLIRVAAFFSKVFKNAENEGEVGIVITLGDAPGSSPPVDDPSTGEAGAGDDVET